MFSLIQEAEQGGKESWEMEWDSGIIRGVNSKGLGGQTVINELS